MSDLKKRQLRGSVKTVRTEWFEWDSATRTVQERARRWEELTFSPAGKLVEYGSSSPNGNARTTYFHDEAGRLRETVYHNPDGTKHSYAVEYDERGEVVDPGVRTGTVNYSTENGRGVKTEIFNRNQRSVGSAQGFGFHDGGTEVFWNVNNAAVISTFYNERGWPTELVFYDTEHVQLSKVVRTYDDRGRVRSEQQEVVSQRLFGGTQEPTGEEMPPELQRAVMQAFTAPNHAPGVSYQYDEQDRVVERTQTMGLFGSERTVSEYNSHGEVTVYWHYESLARDLPLDHQGNILPPSLPTLEKLTSETRFSYEYDDRGNWTRKTAVSRPAPNQEASWSSVEVRQLTYY